MKKLYLVRHGETLFNHKYLIQGMCDSPLTEKGHMQAQQAGQIFNEKGISFDHAYCSMLHRIEETIQEITSMPYERRNELNERCYGTMEGESRKIAEAFTWQQRSKLYELCGGESEEHLKQRMISFLTSLMEKEDHNSVLCVSHGAAIGFFMHNIGQNIEITHLKNCHILEFGYDGQFHFLNEYYPENG